MSRRRVAGGKKAATRKTSGGKKEQPRKSTTSKRGTKTGTPVTSDATTQSDTPVPTPSEPAPSSPRLARVVGITPQDRELEGYRELDVRALRGGHYAGRDYAAGDVFRMALVGEGEPPVWVRPV